MTEVTVQGLDLGGWVPVLFTYWHGGTGAGEEIMARDFDSDAREAMALLEDARPEVAELVESGTLALHVIEAGRFGVDSVPGAAYSVVVDVREGTVES